MEEGVSNHEAPFIFGRAKSISSRDGKRILYVDGSEGGTVTVPVTEQQAAGLLSRLGDEHSVTLTLELAGGKSMSGSIQRAIDDLSLTRFASENKEEAEVFIRRTIDDTIQSLRDALRGGF